jgi:outer membrane protein assembly factor BamB
MSRTALIAVVLYLGPAALLPAAVLKVPDDYPTIQEAVNASTDGDEVVVLPGTYTGPGNRDIDLLGKAITVRSLHPGNPPIVAATIIDCNGTEADPHRGFYLDNREDANTVLNGLTITNGYAEYGGGIYCGWRSAPSIINCSIAQNVAQSDGGGIYTSGGIIANCNVTDNTANWGGGIWCAESTTVKNCTITRNLAREEGGGIYTRGGTITGCTIIENYAGDYGGGVGGWWEEEENTTIVSESAIARNASGRDGAGISDCANVTNCVITGNSAGDDGGGLSYCANVSNCIITGNSAGDDGGGVCFCLNVKNCLISANIALDKGGGVYSFAGLHHRIENCTLSANTAPYGGGIAHFDPCPWFSVGTSHTLTNSILWANSDQIWGGFYTVSYCCIEGGYPGLGNIDADPLFIREPNDGGDSWGDDPCTPDVDEGENDDFGDLHLTTDSPCIDAGEPGLFVNTSVLDIDGQPRAMGGRVDIGADEFLVRWLAVTKPRDGEVWAAGSRHEIAWSSYALEGKVRILFSGNGGGDWKKVKSSVGNTGSYMWSLPDDVDSNDCLISVVPRRDHPEVECTPGGPFTIHPDSPGPAVAAKWKSLGGDFDRAGLSDDRGPILGCVMWRFDTNEPVSASVTIGADNRVHVPCEDGKLYTLDANGALLWSYDTNSPLISAPTIGPDGTVYAGSENGTLYAIDANGHIRWTHTTDGPVYSSPAVSPDVRQVYVCSTDGGLDALGRDGSELWSFETGGVGALGGAIFASPAVGVDGTVYTSGFNDANLYALNPEDGTVKWVCSLERLIDPNFPWVGTTSGRPFASAVVAEDGTIYQTSLYDPTIYAVDPCNGGIFWTVQPRLPLCGYDDVRYDARGWSEPALGPHGTIYVSWDDPNLHAVDPNGTIKWVKRLGLGPGFTLTVGSDGFIYAAGDDGALCVLDAHGTQVTRFQGERWAKFPVVGAGNTLIVADANGVAAIGGDCPEKPYLLHRPQDLNADLFVNFTDFAALANDWLDCEEPPPYSPYCSQPVFWYGPYSVGDINRNRCVDFADLKEMTNRWLLSD